MKEKIETQKRKQNMRLYSIYRALSMDLLFIYAIDFLFLTQVKNISASDVVLKSSFYAFFMIIMQLPANILIDKIGIRKSVILANVFNTMYFLIIIFSRNLQDLIVAEFFSALCFSIKDVSDTTLLGLSIPESEHKGDIFSKIEGKGNQNYYYINAITSVLAGFLYTVNPYIPMILGTLISIFAIILSLGFQKMENDLAREGERFSPSEYMNDIIKEFKFIVKSNRIRSLILYSGIMWGIFVLISTYRTSLLEEVGISATWIAIVTAIVGIASGIGSKYQLQFHKMFKNKSLSVLAITTAVTIILSGIVGLTNLQPNTIMILITIFFIISNFDKGVFGVLTSRYLGNFASDNIITKIYSINNISRNVFRMIIGFLGSYLLNVTNTANSFIITGIIFIIVLIGLITYMKTRIGLKPEDYKKEDIEFDIS